MTGGLNDDFPLGEVAQENDSKVTLITDDNFDETLFENPVPGEVPELKENLDVIVQIKNKVDDLEYFRQDVTKAGGMNGSFALEAARHIPDFFNEDLQPGYFTKDISKTHYNVTLEAIDSQKKSLIVSIVEHIRAFIGKCIHWVRQLYDRIVKYAIDENSLNVYNKASSKEIIGTLSKMTSVTTDAEKEMSSLKARVQSNFKDIDADEFFTKLEQRFESLQNEVQSLYNSVNSSRLNRAVVFSPAVLNLCFVAANEETKTLHAFKALYDFAIDVGNGKSDFSSVQHHSKNLQEFYEQAVLKVVDKIKIGSTGLTPSEALERLKGTLDEMGDRKVDPSEIPLNKLVSCFSNLFSVDSARKALANLGHCTDDFASFQSQLSNRGNLNFSGSPQDVAIATKLLMKLSKEFNDHFVLRLNYGNLLNFYVTTGRTTTMLLKKYNRDIFIATATMDEKFQDFIKAHFSNGNPNFFTTIKE